MSKKLLVVGTMAYDAIETPYQKVDRILGGAATYIALASSKFSNRCGLVSVIGEDFVASDMEKITSLGINADGVEQVKGGKTFFWSGRYHDDMNTRTTMDTQLNVLEHFTPQVPEAFRDSEVVVIGNLHPAVQKMALDQLTNPDAFTLLDSMNFWMENFREILDQVIAGVNLISINDEEARILTGEFSLTKAAKKIHAMGPRYVIIKKGEHGAQLYGDGKVFIAPAYPIDQVVDPTGAGDSFAGGLAGFLAQADTINFETIKQALVVGSVFASFTVEAFGVKAIEEVQATALNERIHRFRELTAFEWNDKTLNL
ncbi:MAG: PfkB family carbohydrate kinase [Flavobacteriaceae bacterium]